MSTYLVTGASGFIGGQLCRQLRSKSETSTILAMSRTQRDGPWDRCLEWDLSSGISLPEGMIRDVDVIFHLASKAHAVSEVVGDDSGYHEVIVSGTKSLLEAAEKSGCKALVYMSSVKAMGEGSSYEMLQPIDETSSCSPETPYGRAKLEAERLVLSSYIPHVVVIRPVMVYGPNHKGNLVRMVEMVKKGLFPPLPENGNKRSMVHVDDLISATTAASECPNANRSIFIIAEDDALSTRQLIDHIRISCGMKSLNWSAPRAALSALAATGDIFGKLFGKRAPFDSSTLDKLLQSAWYSSLQAKQNLGWIPQNNIKNFISNISAT